MELAASLANGYSSSGGWWVAGDMPVAYANTWSQEFLLVEGIHDIRPVPMVLTGLLAGAAMTKW
ncbi:MAG: hypothetical protein R3B93_12995 [Bacteroidia bacterium]